MRSAPRPVAPKGLSARGARVSRGPRFVVREHGNAARPHPLPPWAGLPRGAPAPAQATASQTPGPGPCPGGRSRLTCPLREPPCRPGASRPEPGARLLGLEAAGPSACAGPRAAGLAWHRFPGSTLAPWPPEPPETGGRRENPKHTPSEGEGCLRSGLGQRAESMPAGTGLPRQLLERRLILAGEPGGKRGE